MGPVVPPEVDRAGDAQRASGAPRREPMAVDGEAQQLPLSLAEVIPAYKRDECPCVCVRESICIVFVPVCVCQRFQDAAVTVMSWHPSKRVLAIGWEDGTCMGVFNLVTCVLTTV